LPTVQSSLSSLVLVSALAALAGCGGQTPAPATPAPASDVPQVTGAEAHQLVADGAILLDVSPTDRFPQTRIEGAINIPWDQLERRLSELPQDRPIVVYCGSGRASPGATRSLLDHGYDAHLLGARANYFPE